MKQAVLYLQKWHQRSLTLVHTDIERVKVVDKKKFFSFLSRLNSKRRIQKKPDLCFKKGWERLRQCWQLGSYNLRPSLHVALKSFLFWNWTVLHHVLFKSGIDMLLWWQHRGRTAIWPRVILLNLSNQISLVACANFYRSLITYRVVVCGLKTHLPSNPFFCIFR